MNWFESLIYGLISGMTEFLPISSSAHQEILKKLFGLTVSDPAMDMLIHICLLLSVFFAGHNIIDHLRRQHARVHSRQISVNTGSTLELRFLKNAVMPFILVYLLLKYGIKIELNLAWIALFSLINGILLFSQGRMMQGSKDERFMSILGSVLIGIAGAFSTFSGISRIGCMLFVLTALGVALKKASDWVIVLSIPALILAIGIDVLNIITAPGNIHFFENILGYILAAFGAYTAGCLGITFLKSLSGQRDHTGFAYYSWGVALFSFFMYLTVA